MYCSVPPTMSSSEMKPAQYPATKRVNRAVLSSGCCRHKKNTAGKSISSSKITRSQSVCVRQRPLPVRASRFHHAPAVPTTEPMARPSAKGAGPLYGPRRRAMSRRSALVIA